MKEKTDSARDYKSKVRERNSNDSDEAAGGPFVCLGRRRRQRKVSLAPPPHYRGCRRTEKNNNTENDIYSAATPPPPPPLNLRGCALQLYPGRHLEFKRWRWQKKHPPSDHSSQQPPYQSSLRPIDREKKYYYIYIASDERARVGLMMFRQNWNVEKLCKHNTRNAWHDPTHIPHTLTHSTHINKYIHTHSLIYIYINRASFYT